MKRFLFIAIFILIGGALAFGQDKTIDKVCISQKAANKCRNNALELSAAKEKMKVLEEALKEKEKSIRSLEILNKKNIADLTKLLRKLEAELAMKTGQLIGAEKQIILQTEIIKAMIPMLRKKKVGLINIF